MQTLTASIPTVVDNSSFRTIALRPERRISTTLGCSWSIDPGTGRLALYWRALNVVGSATSASADERRKDVPLPDR